MAIITATNIIAGYDKVKVYQTSTNAFVVAYTLSIGIPVLMRSSVSLSDVYLPGLIRSRKRNNLHVLFLIIYFSFVL